MTEQTLRALGAATCADLLAMRGVLAALYSAISSDFFVAAALGIGRTHHSEMVREGEVPALPYPVPYFLRTINWCTAVAMHVVHNAVGGQWQERPR